MAREANWPAKNFLFALSVFAGQPRIAAWRVSRSAFSLRATSVTTRDGMYARPQREPFVNPATIRRPRVKVLYVPIPSSRNIDVSSSLEGLNASGETTSPSNQLRLGMNLLKGSSGAGCWIPCVEKLRNLTKNRRRNFISEVLRSVSSGWAQLIGKAQTAVPANAYREKSALSKPG